MKKHLFILTLFLLPVCVFSQADPASKVKYFQAGDKIYYKEDVVVPKVSKEVDADYRDAVDVGGGTKGTKVNKPKTKAVVQPQRYPTNVPTNNPNEVQLKGGQKVVTPHNSSPKVAMPKGKPMPKIGQTQDTKNIKPVTKPVEQKTVTPTQPKEQKLTTQEVKKAVPPQEPKATTAPVNEDKYARPKSVHLKDYQIEYYCAKGDTKCEAEQAKIKEHNEKTFQEQTGKKELKAPAKAKIGKPKVSSSPAPIDNGIGIKDNGVIIPEKHLKYGVKTKCVPLPGKTTCEEEKKPTNKLAGYKPSNGVELPEATLPEGVKPTITPAKQGTAKLDTVDTPKRADFRTEIKVKDTSARKNLLEGYSVTANSNVEIPKASLPTEAEMDAQDARARAEMEAEQLLAEMEYKKAQAAAQQAKAQAQAAKNQAKQQQNAANLTCSYMGTYFRGNTCKYCVNHKPSNSMECNQCCQSFGRPLMQPASYRAFSSGGRPAGCLCRFGPTSGYNF